MSLPRRKTRRTAAVGTTVRTPPPLKPQRTESVKEDAMKRVTILLLLILLSVFQIVAPSSDEPVEWNIVTKQNFSSLIRIHPHALLVVTLPWSGEARSVMKDIADAVRDQKEESLRSLKLLFMYKNVEKMLAGSIGASEETTVLYYHHSTSYKYRGRLRARNILSSVLPYLTTGPEDISLKHLKSEEELEEFLQSTDRGVLLLEFCGWTPKLLDNRGNISVHNSDAIKNEISTGRQSNHPKSSEGGFMQCKIENEASGIPWLGELNSLHYSTSEVGEVAGPDLSCNFEEFQRFETFFSKFITSVREFFLPSERQKFGLISERALLTPLQIGKLDSWSVSVQHAGCPCCSKNIHEVDDLRSVLLDDDGIVLNLEDNGHNIEPALPANKPSIILFVDRSSNSSKTRRESKEALHSLRELALLNRAPTKGHKAKCKNPGKPSLQMFVSSRGASGHPTFKLYSSSRRKTGDKMSVMIVKGNDGNLEQLTSDEQGSSLHEIFTYLLQQKSEAKLSSLAKKAGFELLSDDMEVKLSSSLSAKILNQPIQGDSGRVLLRSQMDREEDQLVDVPDLPAPRVEENMESIVLEPLELNDKYKNLVGVSKMSAEAELEDLVTINGQVNLEVAEEDETSSDVDELGKQIYLRGFQGSFYFCDGDNQLLRALTGRSKIPSLVIVDPILHQHYVFPDEENISYITLVNYLNRYLNKSLIPYQKSESVIPVSKDVVHPPFVNLDFHEADAIPRITAKAFSKMLQAKWSEDGSSTHETQKDVLVLFSNNWCGFCQRMELIVREVYRAFKGYMIMLTHQAENRDTLPSTDNLEGIKYSLPLIYTMDCTSNDCSQILNSLYQREVYPALVLFPAQNKDAVTYEGDIAVTAIIKFIASQGSHSRHYSRQNGILWTLLGKQRLSPEFSEKHSPNGDNEEDPEGNQSLHEVLLVNRIMPERTVQYRKVVPRETNAAKQKVETRVVVGSILVATDKLLGAHPFDKSMILIVKADANSGFQGLIINKPISWDSVSELEKDSEVLKEAPLSLGGPLIQQGFPLVTLTRKANEDEHPEVLPGTIFLNQLATIKEVEELKLGTRSVADYWFFMGFASWNWVQLFDEIAEGAWTISDDSIRREFQWPRT